MSRLRPYQLVNWNGKIVETISKPYPANSDFPERCDEILVRTEPGNPQSFCAVKLSELKPEFGLTTFPGETFRLQPQYLSESETETIMVRVQIQTPDGWEDFCHDWLSTIQSRVEKE